MNKHTAHKSAPAEWNADLEIAKAEIEAGVFVDSEMLIAETDSAIARLNTRKQKTPKSEVA